MGYGYHIDEGRLELPPAFKDLSVNVFEWSDEDREATVFIQRHAKSPSDAFADVVATLRQRLIESVAASWELEPLDLDVDLPAISLRLQGIDTHGHSYRHHAILDLGERVLVITASGHIPSRLDAMLYRMVSGIRSR